VNNMFRFSNPKKFQELSDNVYPWMNFLAFIFILIGLYYSFFNSPPDYLQGETVRIMYIHVPSAWLSLMIYSSMGICSIISLIWKHTLADIISRSCAPIGASFTLVTLITGSIWGKPTWGTWWVWDARLTSELILLFIYLGHIILSNAFDDFRKGDKNAAILAIVGLINLPIIKWSVDWWNTLHQPASLTKFGAPSIDSVMLFPLIFMALGLTFLFVSILLDRIKGEIYLRKIELFKQEID
tara:strand:- start:145 stop:867 length:723 start_codon:yes stop_codon:yes gene_type:complete